jgi:signal transduction histidine kinase
MPADTVKTLTTIRNSGARLLNLINDILDAAALRKVGGRRERAAE